MSSLEKCICIYRKRVDWSLFMDGFAIPLEQQEYFQNNKSLKTEPGERKAIKLLIDTSVCAAELRNLPINIAKHPEHSPIIQIRYRRSDEAAKTFKKVFWRSWEDMSAQKSSMDTKKRVRTDYKEEFVMYTTDDPLTFIIECFPADN